MEPHPALDTSLRTSAATPTMETAKPLRTHRAVMSPVGDEVIQPMPMGQPLPPKALFDEGLLTVKEASDIARLSPSSIYNLMDRGALGYVRSGRARRIAARELYEFLAKRYVPPRI